MTEIKPVAWVKTGGIPEFTADPLVKMAWESDGHIVAPLYSAPAPELVAVLKDLLAELKSFADEIGGCDHSVGICMCETFRKMEAAEALLARIEGEQK